MKENKITNEWESISVDMKNGFKYAGTMAPCDKRAENMCLSSL